MSPGKRARPFEEPRGDAEKGSGGAEARLGALPRAAAFFLAAMERRYACKRFDAAKPLPPLIRDFILECGRLSPSSFGLEPWRFVAVEDRALIDELRVACFDQEAVASSALTVVTLVRRAPAYSPDSAFVRNRASRFPGGVPVFVADYEGYYEFLRSRSELEHWARAQSYIACANMLTGAASARVDSCAIEGYEEDEVLGALGADPGEWRVGIVASFGYRAEERRERVRESLSSISELR
jgi:nitroreductase